MPTGVALRDAREQLFDAAERLLLNDGPSALSSRAVTAEAGVAKGVLHRHFADFDAFLAEFVLDRAERMNAETAALREAAGTGTVAENLTEALVALFGSVAVAVIPLIAYRDELRDRLRETWPVGVPVLTAAAELIAEYLAAERALGRLREGADVETVAATLIGTGHLRYADRASAPPEPEAIGRIVRSILAGVAPPAA